MKIVRLMRIVFALLAILFVTFQPIMVPVAYAVESWNGSSWEGNPWEGKSWDGSSLQWEGNSWTGKSTQGESWSGKSTNGDSWNGKGTDGEGTDGQGWNSEPWYMEGWTQPVIGGDPSNWLGRGTTGNPWLKPGWSGDGTTGNVTVGKGTEGKETNADVTDISTIDIPEIPELYNNKGYRVSEYVLKDVIGGMATLSSQGVKYQRFMDAGANYRFDYGGKLYANLLVNGFKLGGLDNYAVTGIEAGTKLYEGFEGYGDFQEARDAKKLKESLNKTKNLLDATEEIDDLDSISIKGTKPSLIKKGANFFNKINPPAPVEKVLSKFSVPGAAIASASAGAKTWNGIANTIENWDENDSSERTASIAGAGENFGDFLMNAGVVTAAFPGAQAAGGVMVAAGAGIWAVSKGVKFVAKNWGTVTETYDKVKNTVKKTAKKAWDTVTGLFS